MARFVITGTGTEIGKTVFAAGLTGLLKADYWKPVQSGLNETTDPAIEGLPRPGTDAHRVAVLTGAKIWPSVYVLNEPLSPHRAAEIDGVSIDIDALTPPPADRLVIEGAGGVLVPVTRQVLFADLFARWDVPVILCAVTGLGTISHTVSAVESLQKRGVPLHGIAFIGDDNPDNIRTIAELTGARVLGRLPILPQVTPEDLGHAMTTHFNAEDFA